MKIAMMALVLVLGGTSSAFAAPVSCGQLIAVQAELRAELSYIAQKIRASHNGDVVEFYMDQYEKVQEQAQNVTAKIENNCK